MSLYIGFRNYGLSELKQLQYTIYHFIVVKPYTLCVLNIVLNVVKCLVKSYNLIHYHLQGRVHTIKIIVAELKLEPSLCNIPSLRTEEK